MKDKRRLVNFALPLSLIARLDEFRWAHRFKNRATALRWLVTWAISQHPVPPPREERPEEMK